VAISKHDIDRIYTAIRPRLNQQAAGSGSVVVTIPAHTHDAADITMTPVGEIASTNVQAGLAELDSEKLARDGSQTMLGALDMDHHDLNNVVNADIEGTATVGANVTMTGGIGSAIMSGLRRLTMAGIGLIESVLKIDFTGAGIGDGVIDKPRVIHMTGSDANNEARVDGLERLVFNNAPAASVIDLPSVVRFNPAVTAGIDTTYGEGHVGWDNVERTLVADGPASTVGEQPRFPMGWDVVLCWNGLVGNGDSHIPRGTLVMIDTSIAPKIDGGTTRPKVIPWVPDAVGVKSIPREAGITLHESQEDKPVLVMKRGLLRNANIGNDPHKGDVIWGDPSTPGGITKTFDASGSNERVRVGICYNRGSSEGPYDLWIDTRKLDTLTEASFVEGDAPAIGDVLIWNGAFWSTRKPMDSDIGCTNADGGAIQSLEDVLGYAQTPGLLYCDWDDAGGGNLHVSSGAGLFRTANNEISTISYGEFSEATFAIPVGEHRYIGVNWNGGSPVVEAHTSDDWDYETTWPIGNVYCDTSDSAIHLYWSPRKGSDLAGQISRRLRFTRPFEREDDGLVLGETGARNPTVSGGWLWEGDQRHDMTVGWDCSAASRFDIYYRDGSGGFSELADQAQWPNDRYDDGTGALHTMTAGKYAVIWWYIQTDGDLIAQFGRAEYDTIAAAHAEGTPTPSAPHVQSGGLLIGRYIFQKSASTAAVIETVWDSRFSPTSSASHGALSGRSDADQHPASSITNTPAGTIASTNVQAALDELDSEKVPTTRTLSTTAPLTGGGDLSANRTLAIDAFTGDAGAGGAKGAVPAPAAGDAAAGKFLKASGAWVTPPGSALPDLVVSKHVLTVDTTIAAGYGCIIPRYLELAGSVNLEIGADADLEIS
jgi:hypothetical protein